MLSNGPGNPADNQGIIEQLALLCQKRIPTFGICLGHQLLALSQGGRTHKLKYGHRGANQPVRDLGTGRVYITSQNHGYAVDGSQPAPQRRSQHGQCQRPALARASNTPICRLFSGAVPPGSLRWAAGYCILVRPIHGTDGGGPLMPRNPGIKKVLVIGSGPIVIGQAAEFDYAGTQACRALKEEGLEVVLINSNPATIMTDGAMADQDVYRTADPGDRQADHRKGKAGQPALHPGRPDRSDPFHAAGQGRASSTSTTCALLGADPETIDKAEDRQLLQRHHGSHRPAGDPLARWSPT